MATISTSTPLWLELRKEYIDDNFEQLLTYLKDCSLKISKDTFYETTIGLMRERIIELLEKLCSRPLYQEQEDNTITTFNIRLLATFILAVPNDPISLQAYVAMMSEFNRLTPKFSDQIIIKSIERLTYSNLSNPGYGWNDIIDFKDEIFAFHVVNNCKFDQKLSKPLLYEHFGTALLNADGLLLTHETQKNALKLQISGANSLDTGIGVTIRTTSNEKLKQSESSHLSAMDDYLKSFIVDLWKTSRKNTSDCKLRYIEGDEVIVRITDIDRNNLIHVETIDAHHEKISGVLHFSMPNIIYYSTTLFSKYFQKGDFLKVIMKNADKKLFDIQKNFIEFVVEDCRTEYGMGELPAKLLYKNKSSLVWINERGTHLYSKYSDEYQIGDMAYLEVSEYCNGKEYGKIHTYILEPLAADDDTEINEEETKRDTIRDFAKSTPVPSNIMLHEVDHELSPIILKLLLRLFFEYQKSLLKPSDRYRFLANARIMAEMTNDQLASSYIKFASSYLRVLVQFVNNESIKNITLEPEEEFREANETRVRLSIVQILKEYGRKDNSEILAETISNYEEELPVLARIARLVQTANSMQGMLSDAAITVIKREIIRSLSLETANDTNLEADSGNYLGVESGTVEFKTSFIYPSGNNMQPNEVEQELNVFRGICAFLNSETGGTLYLGVNDQGYVVGIENDMKFLRMTEVDTYQRHIQDRAKHYFDIDGIVHLRMEPLFDKKVIAIHVKPHPYRVVELNGTAYLRVNAESREMPEKVKQEMLSRKIFTDKNRAAAISMLQQACARKRQTILHQYSSGNSLSVKDRLVEPFKVLPQKGLVMCCDVNDVNRKSKIFSIDRIGYVEILNESPWQYQNRHVEIPVDAFNWTGEKAINVSLKLDVTSKNLLVEEYPDTKKDLAVDSKDSNRWYLNTKVYNIKGIARFYIGLANHIEILDCPQLKSYVEEFKQYL